MKTKGLLALALAAGAAWAQDFHRADQVPLPDWGVVQFEFGQAEYVGFSPSRGLLFRSVGSTEGLGGNPDIQYVLVDPDTGQTLEEIQVNFNMLAVGSPDDEDRWADLERQNAEMAEEAEREIGRIHDLDRGTSPDTLYGTGGVARCTNPENLLEGGSRAIFRFYAYHEHTGWLRPVHESGQAAYNPEAVRFARSYLTGGGTMLMLEFSRFPVMEFDVGSRIFLLLSPEQTAQYFNEVGFAWYGAKDYEAALVSFQVALSCFPDYAKSAYNAACVAALLRDVPTALHFLEELARIGRTRVDDYAVAAVRSLAAVDRDADFNAIRADPRFVSGLSRLRP